MIIILMAITILILGIIGMVISEKDIIHSYSINDTLGVISFMLFAGSTFITMILLIAILLTNVCANHDIQKSKFEYDSLIARLEVINSDYEDVSKSDVIKDIYEWNKSVYNEKYWGNNAWTNWFYNKRYVDSLEYIEIDKN